MLLDVEERDIGDCLRMDRQLACKAFDELIYGGLFNQRSLRLG